MAVCHFSNNNSYYLLCLLPFWSQNVWNTSTHTYTYKHRHTHTHPGWAVVCVLANSILTVGFSYFGWHLAPPADDVKMPLWDRNETHVLFSDMLAGPGSGPRRPHCTGSEEGIYIGNVWVGKVCGSFRQRKFLFLSALNTVHINVSEWGRVWPLLTYKAHVWPSDGRSTECNFSVVIPQLKSCTFWTDLLLAVQNEYYLNTVLLTSDLV